MPLLTQNQLIDAEHIEDSRNIASHVSAAITAANQIVQRSMKLNDAALASWLNSHPAEEQLGNFAAHGQLGEALNAAYTVAVAVLAANGITVAPASVDVRSVAEKLADRGRILDFTDGVFAVSTPPPPEPEPEPEPQPE